MLHGLMAGIRKYQLHPYTRTLSDLPAVWRAGEMRLLHAGGAGRPLLLVPSMINGSSILDLIEGRSLARWLAGRGHDVYLLDWGRSTADEGQADIDTLLRERLVPALRHLAGDGPVDALGYCMGGTLLAAAAPLAGDALHKLVFLATPWDFHAGDRKLQAMVQYWSAAGLALTAQQGVLPADWVQTVFASVDPHMALRKFTDFAAMEDADPRAALFVAVEDWLNDAADLPRAIAQTCIQDWYLDNLPQRGRWRDLSRAALPHKSLVVAAKRDRLVPPESSRALFSLLPDAAWQSPDAGHIGLIAGENAPEDIWTPLERWLSN